MILDTLSQAPRYAALHPLFAQAIDFLMRGDLASLAPGKYPIDGDNLWATISEESLRRREDSLVEAHDRYIDIHLCLRGEETIGWRARSTCREVAEDRLAEQDIIFYQEPATQFITLHPGEFAVFFPDDGHQPLLGEGTVRKCILKIKVFPNSLCPL
ncbi:MAG: YhcH/YjgK/YiaL family protein [Rikenellaceae bacterium]|jgi:YhcH/YjgK/YiaL family protein|nr:YhcH/YjgK/YiaL family protein [Rikenellaceae bacterium]